MKFCGLIIKGVLLLLLFAIIFNLAGNVFRVSWLSGAVTRLRLRLFPRSPEEEEEETEPLVPQRIPQEATVLISGWAYPNCLITISQDGQIIDSFRAEFTSDFETTFSVAAPATHTFNVWAEDDQGCRSRSFVFTVELTPETSITISDIFLSPTVSFDKQQVRRGENIAILGWTKPESKVAIYIFSTQPLIKEVKADENGIYFYELDTTFMEEGEHIVKVRSSVSNNLLSDFSKAVTFKVLPPSPEIEEPEALETICIPANLNCDFTPQGANIVDIIDVSILLYNWGTPKNIRADLNNNGKVDIIDFSIMLYYWTG